MLSSRTSNKASIMMMRGMRRSLRQATNNRNSNNSINNSINNKQRAWSSNASSETPDVNFSIYEYPTRTEPPIITKTSAKDIDPNVVDEPTTTTTTTTTTAAATTTKSSSSSSLLKGGNDPFDDQGVLSKEERYERRINQETNYNIPTSLNSLPITDQVPDFIPPNVPSNQLEVPETIITTLDNGIRVVSQETYGQMCTMGVLTNVGSRHEPTNQPYSPGIVHLLETMAFGPSGNSQYQDGLEINQLLQDWGATRFVSHSREQTLHCIDILRPNTTLGMELLSNVVLEPHILQAPEEFEHAKAVLDFQASEQLPELVLGEALQVAAYGGTGTGQGEAAGQEQQQQQQQQLGKLHFATHESIPHLTPEVVEQFFQDNIRNNPEGMVIAGAGIDHDKLVKLSQEFFGHVEQKSAPTTIPSDYIGGSHLIPQLSQSSIYAPSLPEEEFCRVALAFPVGGWHSDTMVTACVLQTLLGGGSSFSAGGPGKGMYSRMYQQVLNRYGWMETAEAFTTFADEGGLFGVSASTPIPQKVSELVMVLADQLARLAVQPVHDIELSRARNMLKCNVLTQLESRLILFEDMGRQVLTYGKREDAVTTCRKIDSVTAEDIQQLAQDMLQHSTPTLAAYGSHLEQVPSHEEVSRWFR